MYVLDVYAAHNGAIYPGGEITMKKGNSIEILVQLQR